ncbi:MAG: TonB-dependent receptor, partial [Flavobacterium sp.]
DFGKSQTAIAKYDAAYSFTPKIVLNAVADFTQTTGKGSDVNEHTRQISSIAMLFKQQIGERFRYEAGLRKEITGNYESPLLFSAGIARDFGNSYTLRLNGSRNFRIPTFNDLYWVDGGNTDLKPESSYQAEIGNEIHLKKLKFSVTGYLVNIGNMIQWLPGTTALWHPVNVNKVRTYGVETGLNWDRNFGEHFFSISATYGYTVSKDPNTGYQLIYVPYHKATAAVAWNWKKLSADWQTLFNGEVFTRSDNNPRYNIDAYTVSNFSMRYRFGKADWLTLGGRLMNVFDEDYSVVEGRPFPGRNYNMYLTLKF